MRKPSDNLLIGIFLLITTCLFFLPVFTKRTVPLPLNLLVSFYAPWRYEGYKAPNKPIGFDNVRQMLPYMQFTKESLMKGALPLWNPYIFAGDPHMATLQPAFFYPATFINVLLPLVDSWTLLVLIQPVIAGFFTYLFLRSLKLSQRASIIGAASFAFGGWMISWWEEFLIVVHAIIWLPLALYASNLIWQQKRSGYWLLTAALTLSVFAGFTQSTIYLMLTLFAWNTWLWKENKTIRPLGTVLISLVSTILLTSVQWIPAAETYLLSPRSTEDASYIFSSHLLPLTHLVTLFAPDYWGNPGTYNAFGNTGFYQERMIYLGLVPLFFALIAFFYTKNKHASFWKWFTFVTFTFVFAIPTSWIWHTLKVPLLSAMQPTRIMMVSSFGASVLAAYGFEEFGRKQTKNLLIIPIGIMSLIALAGWGWLGWAILLTRHCPPWLPAILAHCPAPHSKEIFDLSPYGTITFRNLLLPSAGLLAIFLITVFLARRRTLFFIAMVMLHLSMMWYFANKYLYFSNRSYLYPMSPILKEIKSRVGTSRVWGYGNASMENNMLAFYDIATPEGYAPFFPHEFGELMGAVGKKGAIDGAIPRSDVTLKRAGEEELMTENPFRLRLMSLLGVKYVMETKNGERKDYHKPSERFPDSLFTLVWENENWRLWEYKNALPRTYLATDIRVVDKKSVASLLFDPKTDLSKTILMYNSAPFIPHTSSTTLSSTIASYTPNNIVISTSTDVPAMLFLSDSYYPGWNAYVDGVKTSVYRADYAFRAVVVPKGKHQVEFKYEPLSWKLGLILSSIGIGLLGLLVLTRNITQLKKK